jgi:hypothetical protein
MLPAIRFSRVNLDNHEASSAVPVSGALEITFGYLRLHLSLADLAPGPAYDERSVRSGFDESPIHQLPCCARLDQAAKWPVIFMEVPDATSKQGPPGLSRFSDEIQLKLNHIPQGVLTTDVHDVFLYDHGLSL